jgi:hypothetical protein
VRAEAVRTIVLKSSRSSFAPAKEKGPASLRGLILSSRLSGNHLKGWLPDLGSNQGPTD